jgi:hypothetical protein
MEIGTYSSESILHKLVAVFSPQLEIFKKTTNYQSGSRYEAITRLVPFLYQEAVMKGHRINIQRHRNGKHSFRIEEGGGTGRLGEF